MQSSDNAYVESREELLLELWEARAPLPRYGEEDEAITCLLRGPADGPEWIVVVAAHDRRMLSTSQVALGLRSGELGPQTLIWRSGMRAWSSIAAIAGLSELLGVEAAPPRSGRPSPAPGAHSPPPTAKPASGSIAVVPAFEREPREAHFDAAPCTRVKQVVMGLSALIMLAVFLTMFAISSARDNMEQRAGSRAARRATAAAPAQTDEDAPTATAALLSEAEPSEPEAPAVEQEAKRHLDTRARY